MKEYIQNSSITFREQLLEIEEVARFFVEKLKQEKVNGEVIAQATIAMRHIEDARMRYGKVIQYNDD